MLRKSIVLSFPTTKASRTDIKFNYRLLTHNRIDTGRWGERSTTLIPLTCLVTKLKVMSGP